MSIHGIWVDPLNVESILNLPPPSTLRPVSNIIGIGILKGKTAEIFRV
jgi:hypothetical protein